jgi:two-component system, NarL family, nitrate/nitrite response regulator NarL
MRVVIVGSARERERLRQDADAAGLVVEAEFETLAEARGSELACDAVLVAPRPPRLAPLEEPLTAREREVLDLLANGLPNKAIAARLGISDQTVKAHVAAICGKLAAVNRTDAVRRAIRRGLVTV